MLGAILGTALLRLDHQLHRVVFPVHQGRGFIHRLLQLLHENAFRLALGHAGNGGFPAFGGERFFKIVIQVLGIPFQGEALHHFRQVVGGFHQLMGRLLPYCNSFLVTLDMKMMFRAQIQCCYHSVLPSPIQNETSP